MGILSISPSLYINKARRSGETKCTVPKKIINIVRIELGFLVLIPLLAVFMAKEYGGDSFAKYFADIGFWSLSTKASLL